MTRPATGPLPPAGPVACSLPVAEPREVFADARASSTVLRASWHEASGCVVLSVWRLDRCVATFHLPAAEVRRFVEVLQTGAEAAPLA